VTCNIPSFSNGSDPHTVTAYQSPNGAKDAIALLANGGATALAVVDLTKMLKHGDRATDRGGDTRALRAPFQRLPRHTATVCRGKS
jgi:hypothetical protein